MLHHLQVLHTTFLTTVYRFYNQNKGVTPVNPKMTLIWGPLKAGELPHFVGPHRTVQDRIALGDQRTVWGLYVHPRGPR